MGVPPKGNNRRKHFRFPTSGPRCQAELAFGQRRIPAQLLDESAGGYAVVVQKCPDFSRGDMLELHLETGVFRVGVVYVCETKPAEPWRTGPIFRVGLQRLGVVTVLPEAGQSRCSWLPAFGLREGSRPRTAAFGFVLALAVVVAIVPVLLTAVLRHGGLQSSSLLSQWSNRAGSLPVQTEASPQGSDPSGLPNVRDAADGSSPANGNWETFARFSGASVFLAPRTIRELALTDAQQREIRRIVEETTEALKEIDARFRGTDREDQARREERVLEDARKLAVEVLTPEQRQRLQAVLARSQ